MQSVTLLARSLEAGVGEDEVRAVFSHYGTVVVLKLLPKRRLAFVEFAEPAELQAALAQGANFSHGGLTCFVSVATGSTGARSDQRQAGLHVCSACGKEFSSRAKLRAHEYDPQSHAKAKDTTTWTGINDLEQFDLTPGAMVADLCQSQRVLLDSYLSQAMPGSPELASIIASVVRTCPVAMRTKELFESLEAAKVIGQHVQDLRMHGQVTEIFDLACGHGLVGILLAYRFPDLQVSCVDLEERPVWRQYLGAWRTLGKPSRLCKDKPPLQNIQFICGAISNVTIGPTTVAVSIHACNEANLEVLEQCKAARAAYAVIPCCIPGRLYSAGNMAITHLPDAARYAVMIGVVASQFGASRVTCIDARITNRHMVILGGGVER